MQAIISNFYFAVELFKVVELYRARFFEFCKLTFVRFMQLKKGNSKVESQSSVDDSQLNHIELRHVEPTSSMAVFTNEEAVAKSSGPIPPPPPTSPPPPSPSATLARENNKKGKHTSCICLL